MRETDRLQRDILTLETLSLNKTRGGISRRLLAGGFGSLVVTGAGAGLGLALSIVLARYLGPAGFGVYSYAMALIMVLSVPVQFGVPKLVVRETAQALAVENWDRMNGVWRWAATTTLWQSAGIAASASVVVFVARGYFEGTSVWTFLLGLGLLPLIGLGMIRDGALRGLGRVVQGQLSELIVRRAVLVLLILSVFPLVDRFGPLHAMASHVVSAMLAFMVGAVLLHRARPEPLSDVSSPTYHRKEWRGSMIPLGLTEGLQLVNKRLDILILGLFVATSEVGVYRAVVQGSLAVGLGLQTLNRVFAPHFARLYAANELHDLQAVVTTAARAALAVTVPAAIVIVIWGEFLLSLAFGSEFGKGHAALAILCLGQVVSAGFGSVGYLLAMTGHERETVRGMGVGVALNVFLNLVLTPLYGAVGAATATTASIIAWNLILYRAAHKRLGIRSSSVSRRDRSIT